jgi:hypothetical protein
MGMAKLGSFAAQHGRKSLMPGYISPNRAAMRAAWGRSSLLRLSAKARSMANDLNIARIMQKEKA